MKMIGEPDAGNPPVRFDEGVQETCGTRVAPAPYSTASPFPSALFDPEQPYGSASFDGVFRIDSPRSSNRCA